MVRQMSDAYSVIVRWLENRPDETTSKIDFSAHA